MKGFKVSKVQMWRLLNFILETSASKMKGQP